MSLLKPGLHPAASDALRKLGINPARIVQTLGHAAASAGTHEADGTVNGLAYSGATDLSVRNPTPWTDAQKREWLGNLALAGFAAFYRWPNHDHWPASEAPHFHIVYAGCVLKTELRRQVKDWLAVPMLNGLASHAPYAFWHPNAAERAAVLALWTASGQGSREIAPPPVKGKHILIHVDGKTLNGELDAAAGIAYYTGGGNPPVPLRVKFPEASFSWNADRTEVEVILPGK